MNQGLTTTNMTVDSHSGYNIIHKKRYVILAHINILYLESSISGKKSADFEIVWVKMATPPPPQTPLMHTQTHPHTQRNSELRLGGN